MRMKSMFPIALDKISNKSDISKEIFSWKEVKENPFELFSFDLVILNFLSNKSNLELKEDLAMEYEIIYKSQLSEI